jgi:hypothetical protein
MVNISISEKEITTIIDKQYQKVVEEKEEQEKIETINSKEEI